MKKWILKALIQKLISFLPGSHKINFWFQKYITKGVRLSDDYLSDKLQHAKDHLRFYKTENPKGEFNSLEIGTGWYPVVPLCMYLAGAQRILTVDLSPLLNEAAFRETVSKFQSWLKEGKLAEFDPYFVESRKAQFLKLEPQKLNLESLMVATNIDYQVGDARSLKEASASFDLIHSNNVFEHIYPNILSEILIEFKRLLKPEGLMSHFIDMSDHFAHLDSSINIYNFLIYSDSAWQRIDNSVQPQNRLRLADYQELYQQCGLEIIKSEARPGEPELLKSMKLAEPFASREPKELAISHVHLVNKLKNA
ncbi:MAG: class I SAM-dependent methyltransferase [Bacteroidetes bacterium]|nr:class I SAM-dependent methyltransferase [Bacteroidota bacterium]